MSMVMLQKEIVSQQRQPCLSVRALFFMALILLMANPGGASAEDLVSPRIPNSLIGDLEDGLPEFFQICHDQRYALCATASCYVYNKVAYCKCDIMDGDSISLPFDVDGDNVCEVNRRGPRNGYMVSTYSVPESALRTKGPGTTALYTCRGDPSGGSNAPDDPGSNGFYAQCDGGLCFTSTEGDLSFPGFDTPDHPPLTEKQIICSCPLTKANPGATYGYQIAGPFPCEDSFFENCRLKGANDRTGSYIPVGSPTGTAKILGLMLDGRPVPDFNECPSPSNGG